KVCRPTESDSIYLKSLNIKLRNFEFPSIRSANSSQKGSQDDLLSDDDGDDGDDDAFHTAVGTELQKSATSPNVLDHNKNLDMSATTTTPAAARGCEPANATQPKQKSTSNRRAASPGRLSQVTQSSVLARDPVAALTQLKAVNETSIYENVNNLPYFDDRASLASFKMSTNATPAVVGGLAAEGDMLPPP
ncbi:hypothetical protein BIW11_04775, partial [Tropilaelaps mercedesae]